MAARTTTAKSSRKGPANTQRPRVAATAPNATQLRMPPMPPGDGLKYALLVAGKSIGAAALVFGAICALLYTSAAPRKSLLAINKKAIARGEFDVESHVAPTRLGSAIVSKIDVPVRDAPRRNGKILDKAIYGSYVDLIGQDGRWVQVRATGQHVTGWVEKSDLNF